MNDDSGFYSSFSNPNTSVSPSSSTEQHLLKRKRKHTKHTFNVYYVGCCSVPDNSSKLLFELAQDGHQRVISTMPKRALVKKKLKIRVSQKCIHWKKEKHYMQDIGHCSQFGSSVLFMVKRSCGRIRAYSVFCQGFIEASKLFDIISLGYRSAKHPTFAKGDPWCTAVEPEFFDDSLQDETFYSRPQSLLPFGSMMELTDYNAFYPDSKNCFSLDDVSKIRTGLYMVEPMMMSSVKSLEFQSDEDSILTMFDSGLHLNDDPHSVCSSGRKVHVVKPVVRVSTVIVNDRRRNDSSNSRDLTREKQSLNYKKDSGFGDEMKNLRSNSSGQKRKSRSNSSAGSQVEYYELQV